LTDDVTTGDLPISGTASDVGGIVSATSSRNTVRDSRIVTPTTQVLSQFRAVCDGQLNLLSLSVPLLWHSIWDRS